MNIDEYRAKRAAEAAADRAAAIEEERAAAEKETRRERALAAAVKGNATKAARRKAAEAPPAAPATEITPSAREALLEAARRIAAEPEKDRAGRTRTGRRPGRPPGKSWRRWGPPDPSVPGDDGYIPDLNNRGDYRTWDRIMDLPQDLQIAIAWTIATEQGLTGRQRDGFIIGMTGVSAARIRFHSDRKAWRASAAQLLRIPLIPVAPIDQ